MFFGSGKIHWTYHVRDKMRFYRLSEARVRRVMNSPKRIEEGVAPNTVAMMQPNLVLGVGGRGSGSGKRETWKQEIWVMLEKSKKSKVNSQKLKIISAWRYPGMSKPRSEILKNMIRQEYEEASSK